jgi:hypothetical protein
MVCTCGDGFKCEDHDGEVYKEPLESQLRELVKEWRIAGDRESWCADELERILDNG